MVPIIYTYKHVSHSAFSYIQFTVCQSHLIFLKHREKLRVPLASSLRFSPPLFRLGWYPKLPVRLLQHSLISLTCAGGVGTACGITCVYWHLLLNLSKTLKFPRGNMVPIACECLSMTDDWVNKQSGLLKYRCCQETNRSSLHAGGSLRLTDVCLC